MIKCKKNNKNYILSKDKYLESIYSKIRGINFCKASGKVRKISKA
jgi:hypothetical protein